MKVNMRLAIGTALVLLATVAPLTNVSAHTCDTAFFTPQTDPFDSNTGCNGASCPDQGAPHDHKNGTPPAACTDTGDRYQNCPHSSPHSHTYGTGGSAGGRSDTATGGDEVGAGIVTVTETNAVDCDGDGVPGDYDGDYESGVGGGFFGFGPWADESTCNYGLRTHGSFVVVSDAVFLGNVFFVIGADDTSGPVVTVDPVDGSTSCSTDGSITPGDPTTDPTADADDCLTDTYVGSGANTCGGGGDGGFWVFLNGVFVEESGGSPTVGSFPTAGTITA